MKGIINQLIRVYSKEDLGFFKYIIFIIIAIMSFIFGKNLGWSMLIISIIFNSYQISTVNCRYGIDMVVSGYSTYMKRKNKIKFLAAMKMNYVFFLISIIYIFLNTSNNILYGFFYVIITYFYANLIGIVLGKLIKKQEIGYAIIIVLFLLMLTKVIFQEEYFRYVSPIIQFSNMHVFYFSNIVGIFIITLCLYVFSCVDISKIRKIVALGGVVGFLILLIYEVSFDYYQGKQEYTSISYNDYKIYYKGIDMEYAKSTGELVNSVLMTSNNYGLNKEIDEIYLSKSIFFFWKSAKEKIPIKIIDRKLEINCFTESLVNMNDKEIITRTIYSIIDISNEVQQGLIDFYIEQMNYQLSENKKAISPSICKFDYNSQIKHYGKIISPKQLFYSEIIEYHPEDFFVVYNLSKKYDKFYELVYQTYSLGLWNKDEKMKMVIEKLLEKGGVEYDRNN